MYLHIQYLIYNKLFYYAQQLEIIMMEYKILNEFQCVGCLITYTERKSSVFLAAAVERHNLINTFRNKILMSYSKVGKLNAQQRNSFNVATYN